MSAAPRPSSKLEQLQAIPSHVLISLTETLAAKLSAPDRVQLDHKVLSEISRCIAILFFNPRTPHQTIEQYIETISKSDLKLIAESSLMKDSEMHQASITCFRFSVTIKAYCQKLTIELGTLNPELASWGTANVHEVIKQVLTEMLNVRNLKIGDQHLPILIESRREILKEAKKAIQALPKPSVAIWESDLIESSSDTKVKLIPYLIEHQRLTADIEEFLKSTGPKAPGILALQRETLLRGLNRHLQTGTVFAQSMSTAEVIEKLKEETPASRLRSTLYAEVTLELDKLELIAVANDLLKKITQTHPGLKAIYSNAELKKVILKHLLQTLDRVKPAVHFEEALSARVDRAHLEAAKQAARDEMSLKPFEAIFPEGSAIPAVKLQPELRLLNPLLAIQNNHAQLVKYLSRLPAEIYNSHANKPISKEKMALLILSRYVAMHLDEFKDGGKLIIPPAAVMIKAVMRNPKPDEVTAKYLYDSVRTFTKFNSLLKQEAVRTGFFTGSKKALKQLFLPLIRKLFHTYGNVVFGQAPRELLRPEDYLDQFDISLSGKSLSLVIEKFTVEELVPELKRKTPPKAARAFALPPIGVADDERQSKRVRTQDPEADKAPAPSM